jgi:hypothetical protein
MRSATEAGRLDAPLRRFQSVPRRRPDVAVRTAASHGVRVRSRVLFAPTYRLIGFTGPALASSFPNRLRGLPPSAVPRHLRAGFILSCASLPSRVLESPPARRLPAPSTFLGVPFPFATSTDGVHQPAGFPSPLCSALGVSHALDGFLLHRPCGFVSPRSHVRDSLSRGFPSHAAVQTRRLPLPSCRLGPAPCRWLPIGARNLLPVSRAFLRAGIRSAPSGFSCRSARSPPELLLLRVLLRAPCRRP